MTFNVGQGWSRTVDDYQGLLTFTKNDYDFCPLSELDCEHPKKILSETVSLLQMTQMVSRPKLKKKLLVNHFYLSFQWKSPMRVYHPAVMLLLGKCALDLPLVCQLPIVLTYDVKH